MEILALSSCARRLSEAGTLLLSSQLLCLRHTAAVVADVQGKLLAAGDEAGTDHGGIRVAADVDQTFFKKQAQVVPRYRLESYPCIAGSFTSIW